jgi:hypothetical protein
MMLSVLERQFGYFNESVPTRALEIVNSLISTTEGGADILHLPAKDNAFALE